MNALLQLAIDKLAIEFPTWNWIYEDEDSNSETVKFLRWPGAETDDIMICVLKSNYINEVYHRQDFFFLNYAYCSSYSALSATYDNLIPIREGECYIGQPYSGYALRADSNKETIIVGVLIKKEVFYRDYLSTLASDNDMFHFFLDPKVNKYSDEFIHLSFDKASPVKTLLEMMLIEYADRKEDTQMILKPLVLALFMQISRRYRLGKHEVSTTISLSDQIILYMSEHADIVTLKDIAAHFSYHPNYISGLLRRETGKSFSELLLEQRMIRALTLLKGTNLSIEEIATMLGYSNSSNFYKAFKEKYHCSPREYME